MPWPWVIQAENRTGKQARALLTSDEYAAQQAAGRSQTLEDALAEALTADRRGNLGR